MYGVVMYRSIREIKFMNKRQKNTRKKDDDNGPKMINYDMSVVRDFLDLTDTDLIAFLMADTKISWVSGFARTSQTIIRNCNDCPYGVSC